MGKPLGKACDVGTPGRAGFERSSRPEEERAMAPQKKEKEEGQKTVGAGTRAKDRKEVEEEGLAGEGGALWPSP